MKTNIEELKSRVYIYKQESSLKQRLMKITLFITCKRSIREKKAKVRGNLPIFLPNLLLSKQLTIIV